MPKQKQKTLKATINLHNYKYAENERMIKDIKSGITSIEYTVFPLARTCYRVIIHGLNQQIEISNDWMNEAHQEMNYGRETK